MKEGEEGFKFSSVASCGDPRFLSRKHFTITRDESTEEENENPPILRCHSVNGMMVNDQPLLKGHSKLLMTGDIIKLDKNTELYTFYDLRIIAENIFPSTVASKYFIGKLLGEGSYGKVRLIYNNQTMEKFAIKTMEIPLDKLGNPKESRLRRVEQEIDIMVSLKHPNLMGLVERADQSLHRFIIMDYMDMDFYCFVNKFDGCTLRESFMKFYFYQLCKGIEHLHQRKIAHRDLKPQNMFVKYRGDGIVLLRIGDFGFSRCDENESFHSQVGTDLFLAPEIVRIIHGGKRYKNSHYTTKADIWALGCLLYLALFGDVPFYPSPEGKMSEKILQGSYESSLVQNVSSEAALLISSIFTVDPVERPSVEMIIRFQWFNDDELRPRVADLIKKLNLSESYNLGETFLQRLVS